MKKSRFILANILLVAFFVTTVSPTYVYADERTPSGSSVEAGDGLSLEEAGAAGLDDSEEASDDAILLENDEFNAGLTETEDVDLEVTDEDEVADLIMEDSGDDDTSEDDFFDIVMPERPPVTFTKEITKIDAPDKTEYSFEYKMILAELLYKLPRSLKVWHDEESTTINIIWKCEENYDKELDEYPFVPDLEGYTLAKETDLPRITVKFEKKRERPVLEEINKGAELNYSIETPEEDYQVDLAKSLPKKYINKNIPKVRDQNPYGTCWAHGTIVAMEADLIHDKKATKKINLSELHMCYYSANYADPKKNRKDKITYTGGAKTWLDYGGPMNEGTHILANLVGAVDESIAPYKRALSISSKLKKTKYVVSKDKYQLYKAYYYSSTDRKGIKKAILDHGAVMAAYIDSDYFYSSSNNSYYNEYGFEVPSWIDNLWHAGGHRIAVVGWDDNFSRYNFSNLWGYPSIPKGDGAWLIRNSWGLNGYGHSGYFWMSYYDKGLIDKEMAVAYDAIKATYKNCYSYDGQNNYDAVYTSKNNKSTQKVSYNISGGETIKAVGIEVASADTKAVVTVKNKRTGKKSTGTLTCKYPGFYTVKLKKQIPVAKKATVDVTIKYSRKKGKVKFVLEDQVRGVPPYTSGMTYKTVCDRGCKIDGKKYRFDPRVKVYTVKYKKPKTVKVKSVSLKTGKKTINIGQSFTLKAKIKPSNATNKKVNWKSSKTKVATVSQKGAVSGKSPGKATITVTTKDGRKKATCTVTVTKKKKK